MPRPLRPLLALLLSMLAVLPAGAASASSSLRFGIADDSGSDEVAAASVAEWRQGGVDVVRAVARWGAIAPAPRSRRPPAGFRATDPASPGYDWSRVDRSVRLAREAGLDVILTVTGAGPVWGSSEPRRRDPQYAPSPARFAQFATAVARRYGADVDEYVIWNEPNQPLWLQPQSTCARGRCTPYAPHLYRRLVRAADPALRRADPGARVLYGALAPRGTSGTSRNAPLRPGVFLRALGCVDARFRRQRGGPCRGFRPVSGEGFAYHPHSGLASPVTRARLADDFIFGDLRELTRLLDRLTRGGRLDVRGARRLPLHLTEFGYQTRPPDRQLGVPPRTQSRWLQQAQAIAYRTPRVLTLTNYLWRDEPSRRGGIGWQSGLRFLDGRAKPALAAFPDPFWVDRTGRGRARVWGQVRPGGAHDVVLERRSGRRWTPVATVRTNGRGAFTRTLRIRGRTTLRFRWEQGRSDARTVSP
jgi:hypothetical protein